MITRYCAYLKTIQIEKVEIVRETEKSVFFRNCLYKNDERREAKETSWYKCHDTFDQAKDWLVNKLEKELEVALFLVERRKVGIQTAKNLTEAG